MVEGGYGFSRALDCMAGAARVRLLDEADAGFGYRSFHTLRLVADDHIDVCRIYEPAGGGDDVAEEGLAADLMQHFGAARFEARAFAGGHDDDGQFLVRFQFSTSHEWTPSRLVARDPCAKKRRGEDGNPAYLRG